MDIIEAPVGLVEVDGQRFSANDESGVFEHLVYYLSHCEELPAITVGLEDGKLKLRGRHKYLRAAQRLGRERICMVVSGACPQEFARLVEQPGVTRLSWEEIDRQERPRPLSDRWHVFYFGGPLEEHVVARFRDDVVDCFFTFGEGARCFAWNPAEGSIEFVAQTPHEHRDWSSKLRGALLAFHAEVLAIDSYQGSRFGAS
jgi:hypothetical protein